VKNSYPRWITDLLRGAVLSVGGILDKHHW
jgi:hypothetical protein